MKGAVVCFRFGKPNSQTEYITDRLIEKHCRLETGNSKNFPFILFVSQGGNTEIRSDKIGKKHSHHIASISPFSFSSIKARVSPADRTI